MAKSILKNKKPKLIDWLNGDHGGILQHVHSRDLITDAEYGTLKSISVPRQQVTELLDIVYGKGEDTCRDFLNLLKEDDVNEFSPQLRSWIKTVDSLDTNVTDNVAQVTASGSQVTTPRSEEDARGASGGRTIPDCEEFLKKNRSRLVQCVKNIGPILDDLGLHPELASNIRAQATDQEKTRKLLEYINSKTTAKQLVDILFRYERDLMTDLS